MHQTETPLTDGRGLQRRLRAAGIIAVEPAEIMPQAGHQAADTGGIGRLEATTRALDHITIRSLPWLITMQGLPASTYYADNSEQAK